MKENYEDNSLVLTRQNIGSSVVNIDKTFTTRLVWLLKYVAEKYGAADMLIDEEAWALLITAEKMNKFQKETISSMEEQKYFENLKKK